MLRLRALTCSVPLLLTVAGCAAPSAPAAVTTPPGTTAPGTSGAAAHRPATVQALAHGPATPWRLAFSTASATTVQEQPAPGSCHARGTSLYALPDPRCTPGALDPAVTQATIGSTICVSGYTRTVRPSYSVTGPEKRASMAAYGDPATPRAFEYDHLVSLELGGAANDERNLWPEPGGSPNPKDRLENLLHRMVCDGQLTLTAAQRAIAVDWVAAYRRYVGVATPQ